jgi:hypothetical protein
MRVDLKIDLLRLAGRGALACFKTAKPLTDLGEYEEMEKLKLNVCSS